MKYKKLTLQDFFEILKDKILVILLLTILLSGVTYYFQTKTDESNLRNYWAVEITKKINGSLLVSYIEKIKKKIQYKNNDINDSTLKIKFEIGRILNAINDITNSTILTISSYNKNIFDISRKGNINRGDTDKYTFNPETFKIKFFSNINREEILFEVEKIISESEDISNSLIGLEFDVDLFNTKDLYTYDLKSLKFIQANSLLNYLKILLISLIVSCFLILAYELRNKIRLL